MKSKQIVNFCAAMLEFLIDMSKTFKSYEDLLIKTVALFTAFKDLQFCF